MTAPPMMLVARIGTYAFVMIAAGTLISKLTMMPRSQPGTGMRVTPIRNPIAKQLQNAPSMAVPLSGCFIGIISATSAAPKIRPAMIPKRIGFTPRE